MHIPILGWRKKKQNQPKGVDYLTMRKQALSAFVFLALIMMSPSFSGIFIDSTPGHDRITDYSSQTNKINPNDSHLTSSDSKTGTLDPIEVEQQGYVVSGINSVRTDTNPVIQYDIPIDSEYNWYGSSAEINVQNLTRLYVMNGTFEEGYPGQNVLDPGLAIDYYPLGWNASAHNPDGAQQTQIASYDDTGVAYVAVENQGVKIGPSGKQYDHIVGTQVIWTQIFENAPYSEDFLLSFSYLYRFGPIGPDTNGNCSLVVFLNGTDVWNVSLPTLDSRGVWYAVENAPIHVEDASDFLNFSIGIRIDETLDLNADEDYNRDGVPEGIANTVYVTTQLDDISFIGNASPEFQAVDMKFNINTDSEPILGSDGVGTGTIANESYWRTDPLPVSVTTNTSISFEYEVRLTSHRISNSTYNTFPENTGVSYSITMDESPSLEAFSYLGFLGEYENLSLIFRYPTDWFDISVINPFVDDITLNCTITDGELWIPESETDELGWWVVRFRAPNYVKNVQTQKLTETGWQNSTLFRSSNKTQASISIGTASATPIDLESVEVTWSYPNGSMWKNESLSGGIEGEINTSVSVLGPENTTAGQWTISVFWENGSEIGFTSTTFDMYHRSYLEAVNTNIDTESGYVITGFVRYRDADNGEYLMDTDASIQGNWSSSVITFTPNDVKNRWEGDFDTDMVDGGVYTILVNASLPYYDDANCTFTITIVLVDNTLTLLQSSAEVNLRSTIEVTFDYEDHLGIGIEDANISLEVPENPGGLSLSEPGQIGSGTYGFNITSLESGTYEVIVTAWKDYYEEAEDRFFLTVGKIGSTLYSLNGTGGLSQIGETYRLLFRYENSTGSGLENATVEIISITPSDGIIYTNVTEIGDGKYTVELTPQSSGIYTLLVRAEILNHREQITSFTLNAPKLGSSLTIINPPSVVAIDQVCTVTFNFSSDVNGGVTNGSIQPVQIPEGLDFSTLQEIGDGIYTIVITPNRIDSYQIVFQATADNYLDASAAISFEVTSITTSYTLLEGFPDTDIEYLEVFHLSVLYQRDNPTANVSGATAIVRFTNVENLTSSVQSVGDIYIISIVGERLGVWDAVITISKSGHQEQRIQFSIQVSRIPTAIEGPGTEHQLVYGRTYNYGFSFKFNSNQTGISGANLIYNGIPMEWVTIVELGQGNYSITITPESIGEYPGEITFTKEGYQNRKLEFSLEISAIPVTIVSNTIIWIQTTSLKIEVDLVETDTNRSVSGAMLTYGILHGQTETHTGTMVESPAGSGSYKISLDPTWYGDNNYKIIITMDKQYHSLSEPFDVQIVETVPPDMLFRIVVYQILPPSIIIIAIGIVVGIGYRTRKRRTAEKFQKALVAKKRFDDADNLIGIIVLHKKSGLSIYSTTLKGGFEETMISAFITAITQFRSEFDKSGEDWNWEVVPISDIIRIVPTRNLICAFITVSPASIAQEEKMVDYARGVGMTLDTALEDTPFEVLDQQSSMILDDYFEEIMDGHLLHYYKRGTAEAFPKKFRCLETTMLETGTQECARPIYIVKNMTKCGITESEACMLVFDAIADELIVPCEAPEIHTHDTVDWAVFEEE